MLVKCKIDPLAVCETKVKVRDEIVNGKTKKQEEKLRKGVI